MMIIVSVMRETGIFEFLAIWAAKRARGRPFPLMVLLILITAVASALLDNVTTVLLIAPVTILLCQRLDLPVVPYLLAEVFASNIGGTATLVGDPPNIIIASRGGLSFNDFLVHLAPVVVVLVAVLIGLCRWLFADAFRIDEKRVAEILALNEREAIQDHRLLWQSLAVLGLVLAAFVLSPVLGYAALGRGAARRRAADRHHPGHHRDRAAGRRVGHPRLLHGPVHHGRRSGRGRRAGGARHQHRRLRRRTTCSPSPACCCGGPGCCPASSTTSPTSPA